MSQLNSKIPEGKLEDKWSSWQNKAQLLSPANKKKYRIAVVGAGLAGASASASLAELGYEVKTFVLHDSPRRAHSIAAQGGINASKNYANDGDSVFRLFYDTIKGGDFRSREANVYRLAQISEKIIDQCVAQGVPFARDYGGLLANRSFGGAQVSRTFYARGQTGQQLLLGAYGSMMRQVGLGKIQLYPYHEMLNPVVSEGEVQGLLVRDLISGELKTFECEALVLCTGGYGNVYYLSTNAMNSNVTASWRCYKKGAYFANPCFVQIHPTCIPSIGEQQSKLTLMSESLRNDGRVWLPKQKSDSRKASDIPEEERDYYLERAYPSFGNLVPRDVASRKALTQIQKGFGVGPSQKAVYLDFAEAIQKQGKSKISEKYGNLFKMYERITGEDPYKTPMQISPAVHYTMGGLWVDYELQSSIKGLFVLGEANFSDHGANRLGASALMQGLADGYFILPYTLGNYLAEKRPKQKKQSSAFTQTRQETEQRLAKILDLKGKKTVDQIHRELGEILWDRVGILRSKKSLEEAQDSVERLKQGFWQEARIAGGAKHKNQEVEKAGRVFDFLELAGLIIKDALAREESCGCHFREEYQTSEQEALRRDQDFSYVSAWEWQEGSSPKLHKEPLQFDRVTLNERNYK